MRFEFYGHDREEVMGMRFKIALLCDDLAIRKKEEEESAMLGEKRIIYRNFFNSYDSLVLVFFIFLKSILLHVRNLLMSVSNC